MDIGKMQGFREWWLAEEQSELRQSCAMGWAFVIWQASRSALVIELPEKMPNEAVGEQADLWFNRAVDECREAIVAAGLKVKP